MSAVGLLWLPIRVIPVFFAQLWAIVEDVVICEDSSLPTPTWRETWPLQGPSPPCCSSSLSSLSLMSPALRRHRRSGGLSAATISFFCLSFSSVILRRIFSVGSYFTPSNFGGWGIILFYTQRGIFSSGPLYCMGHFKKNYLQIGFFSQNNFEYPTTFPLHTVGRLPSLGLPLLVPARSTRLMTASLVASPPLLPLHVWRKSVSQRRCGPTRRRRCSR